VSDVLAVFASPFQGSGKDYLTAALLLGGAGLISLADDPIGKWIYENPDATALDVLKPFREDSDTRLVDLGGGRHLAVLYGVGYLVGLVSGSETIRDGAVGCAAAEKTNGLIRNYVYKGVSRERPLFRVIEGNDTTVRRGDPHHFAFPGTDSWYDNSFFGGHGANIMSCVSFFNHRFEMGLVEPVLWTVAAGVNIGRLADQRHWPSDVAFGAVFGFAIGKYVAERQLARAERRAAQRNGGGEGNGEAEAKPSLLEGLYVNQRDGATVLGWRRSF
jgi:membrane-associated phospholipid phosphatase